MPDGFSLVIREFDDLREVDAQPTTIHILTQGNTYDLDWHKNPSGFRDMVYDVIIKEHFPGDYTFKHIDARSEFGASGSWEEVVLEISKVVASGAAGALVKSLVDGFTKKRKSGIGDVPVMTEISDVQLEQTIARYKSMISTHFVIPKRLLKLVDTERKGAFVTAVFEDDQGQRYRVEEAGPNYERLERIQ